MVGAHSPRAQRPRLQQQRLLATATATAAARPSLGPSRREGAPVGLAVLLLVVGVVEGLEG
eukprot:14708105-Alexandrium_andersonii.AAC.1